MVESFITYVILDTLLTPVPAVPVLLCPRPPSVLGGLYSRTLDAGRCNGCYFSGQRLAFKGCEPFPQVGGSRLSRRDVVSKLASSLTPDIYSTRILCYPALPDPLQHWTMCSVLAALRQHVTVREVLRSLTPGGNISSMVLLALGTHTSLYPVILLAPLLLVLRSNSERQSSLLNIVVFVVSFALLALGATLWLGETWMSRTWGLMWVV